MAEFQFATINGEPSACFVDGSCWDSRNDLLKQIETIIRTESEFKSKDNWLDEIICRSAKIHFIDHTLNRIKELHNHTTYEKLSHFPYK